MPRTSLTHGQRQQRVAQSASDLKTLLEALVDPSMSKAFFGKKVHHRKYFKEFMTKRNGMSSDVKALVRKLKASMTPEVIDMYTKNGSSEVIEYLGLQQQRDYLFVHHATNGNVQALNKLLRHDDMRRTKLDCVYNRVHEVLEGYGEGYEAYDWVCNAILKPAVRNGQWDIIRFLFEYGAKKHDIDIDVADEALLRRCMVKCVAENMILNIELFGRDDECVYPTHLGVVMETFVPYLNDFPNELGYFLLAHLFLEHGNSSLMNMQLLMRCAHDLKVYTLMDLFARAKHPFKLSDWPKLLPTDVKLMDDLSIFENNLSNNFLRTAFAGAPRLHVGSPDDQAKPQAHHCIAYALLVNHYKSTPSTQKTPDVVTAAWRGVFQRIEKLESRTLKDAGLDNDAISVDAVDDIVQLIQIQNAASDIIHTLRKPHHHISKSLIQNTLCRFAGEITLAVLDKICVVNAWCACLNEWNAYGRSFGIAPATTKRILKRLKYGVLDKNTTSKLKYHLGLDSSQSGSINE